MWHRANPVAVGEANVGNITNYGLILVVAVLWVE